MMRYAAALLVVLAVLVFLKYCDGTPFRTWKSVFLTGVPLGLMAGYYFSCALPAQPPPLPQTQKAAAYRAELERDFRRIAGVADASIVGTTVQMNFDHDQPLTELKRIAVQAGGATAHFLKTNSQGSRITVHISVHGRDRYELEYEPGRGVTDERTY
jgi:hypothetical protein